MTATALVVDDDADVRALVRVVLEPRGFEVEESATGSEALVALHTRPLPDIVVLDVQMPDLDGWETLAAIRGQERTATVPVILCTVRAQQADMERAWALGCDGFLAKPFSIGQLVAEVVAVCDRTAAERAALRSDRRRMAGA
jgi:two-component system KDP operon response regulator KdpE